MNKPKELTGRDLLRHAKELEEHLEAGGEVEAWNGISFHVVGNPKFDDRLWRYRKKPKPSSVYLNIYPRAAPGKFFAGGNDVHAVSHHLFNLRK